MANQKSEAYNALKDAGWVPDKPYAQYTTAELEEYAQRYYLHATPEDAEPPRLESYSEDPGPAPAPPAPDMVKTPSQPVPTDDPQLPEAGMTTSTHDLDTPLYTDENGRVWFQKEFVKADGPRPRGRRVVKYTDPGTERRSVTLQDGSTEEYEVPGNRMRASEAKVTLPSYQPAIYLDRGMPFRTVEYRGARGFLYEDICAHYGARDLVPNTIRVLHVSNLLCFDIPTTVRAIRDEAARRGIIV